VKNGFATLADDLFIGDFEVEGGDYWPFPKVIDVVKSSTGEVKKCIFPYLLNGKLMHEDTFRCVCPKAYEWLLSNKKKLEARATTEPWYAFGRTQAIGCVKQRKYAISSLVSPNQPIRITKVNAGAGVYGGLYVLPNFNLEDIEKIEKWLDEVLHSDEFLSYVELLGKYKSGGYYTFSSKECEKYLNWKWNKEKTKEYEHND
jgi:adenine-specific DNA-methyltransferase